jgi:DNA-directed RNA polymerase subunit M/transcription elongation factor TFIIS
MITTDVRLNTVGYIHKITNNWKYSVEIDREIYIYSGRVKCDYVDKAKQIIFNISTNRKLVGINPRYLVAMDNSDLAKGSILERVQEQQKAREYYFSHLLKSKMDQIDTSNSCILKCRSCGSSDISWQQKQTRGADEAMTIFCTCNTCKNRWKMS